MSPFRLLILSILVFLLFTFCVFCNPSQKRIALSIVDLSDKACLLMRGHASDASDDKIKTVCATESELTPYVRDLIDVLPDYVADGGAD